MKSIFIIFIFVLAPIVSFALTPAEDGTVEDQGLLQKEIEKMENEMGNLETYPQFDSVEGSESSPPEAAVKDTKLSPIQLEENQIEKYE